jgi:hypothetical protein
MRLISPLIISFFLGFFVLKCKKEKKYKKGKNVVFSKRGVG